MSRSSPTARRERAAESFGIASECIGACSAGMSLFAITRGQWSMLDAMLHVLGQVGPSRISVWTWTLADYEVEVLSRMRDDGRVLGGTLMIDTGARSKNSEVIRGWASRFGPQSVRFLINHAKMTTIESESGLKFLLRGSMNLNCNPRFEQFDITEGGPEFDLVRKIEDELPGLGASYTCTGKEAYAASRIGSRFDAADLPGPRGDLKTFTGGKTWQK